MITTILFDLDGTLLPMDQDVFLKAYMGGMAKKMASHGYEPQKMIQTIWKGTEIMISNDGSVTNEDALWNFFCHVYGEEKERSHPIFEDFYHNEFQEVANSCGFNPRANETIQEIKAMGFRVALATNPLFPAIATYSRVKWAGMRLEDFEQITTYENSRHCKPNPAYYQDVLEALGVRAEECIMVGNDAVEDLAAQELGIQVFLLTDCLINKHNINIECYPHGSFPELMAFIKGLNV